MTEKEFNRRVWLTLLCMVFVAVLVATVDRLTSGTWFWQ